MRCSGRRCAYRLGSAGACGRWRKPPTRAANPFESVLRAIVMDVKDVTAVPQVEVKDSAFFARVDLADETLRIALEADSFEFHAGRREMDRDIRRYNGLAVRGWLVLRFTWEQVMFEPEYVRAVVAAAVEQRRRPVGRTGTRAESRAHTA